MLFPELSLEVLIHSLLHSSIYWLAPSLTFYFKKSLNKLGENSEVGIWNGNKNGAL